MDSIKFDYSKICNFVTKEEMIALYPEARQALKSLKEGTGKGSDFLGWLNLPVEITSEQLADIEKTAAELRARTQVMVVIGIGGSYLGARAVIEALADSFHNYENTGMKVIFAGHNIGEDYYHELIHYLQNKEFGICVISKSGTTTEPAGVSVIQTEIRRIITRLTNAWRNKSGWISHAVCFPTPIWG